MKTIIFVIATLNRGGAEHSLINLLELMDYTQYKVDLLVFNPNGPLHEQVPSQVRILPVPREIGFLSSNNPKDIIKNFSLKTFLFRIKYMWRKSSQAIAYIKNQEKWKEAFSPAVPKLTGEYDVAVAFMHSLPSYYVIEKVKASRKILWVHNDYSQLLPGKEFDQPYFLQADTIVTISDQCVRELNKAFPEFHDKIMCLLNLNPEEKIRKASEAFIPSEYKKGTGMVLLSIGRLSLQKGFDYAIKTASILKKMKIKFQWYIIGEGELRHSLEEQIAKEDVVDHVFLLGGRINPYPYIKYADIVVQTSRFEGKSIVLDEAKILCKPILTTEYISVHDQIEDGVTGKIVPIDAQAIANGILEMLHQPSYMEYLRQQLTGLPNQAEMELKKYYNCFEGCHHETMKGRNTNEQF